MRTTNRIVPGRVWPMLSEVFLACLFLCAASGLVLALRYRPLGEVGQCVEEITTLAPFGFFFRRLHYYSGQACALLALAHVLHYLVAGAAGRMDPARWARLIGALAACFGLLLTGFMLKGDQGAVFAATVLRSLAESLPLCGPMVSGLLVGQGEGLIFPPYVQHCLLLTPLLYLLMRGHVRRWVPNWRRLAAMGVGLSLWCMAVPMPLPEFTGAGGHEVTGPWFLMGMQEMLRHAPPLLAGVAVPAVFLILLAVLPLLRGWLAAVGRYLVLTGVGLYALLAFRLALW